MPMYMAEDASAADLIAGGRLQLGISRGSPEQVIDGWRYFGHEPAEGESEADMARRRAEEFLDVLRGEAHVTLSLVPKPFPMKWPELPGPAAVGATAPPIDVTPYRGAVKDYFDDIKK